MNFTMQRYGRPVQRIGAVAALAAMMACASSPLAPEGALQAARQAIVAAEGMDAGHSAPGDLGEARSKLAAANAAVDGRKMITAERLAVQSKAAADLASARTVSVKALAVNADMKSSNAALLEELNRKTGESR
jgi:hypothetical protein